MRTATAIVLAACLWLGCYVEESVLCAPVALVLLTSAPAGYETRLSEPGT